MSEPIKEQQNNNEAAEENENRDKVILMTRELTQDDRHLAEKMGLQIETTPLLDYRFPRPPELRSMAHELNSYNLNGVIVTSQNGAIGFKRLVNEGFILKDQWNYYAVGEKTANKTELFLGIKVHWPEQQDSSSLKDLILQKQRKRSRLLYLCGNLASDHLPKSLKEQGIELNTVEIYKTVSRRPVEFPGKKYGAVVFYSPSAVDAFDNNGGFDLEVNKYFAIGPVTAEHLKSATDKEIIVAENPSTESLFEAVSNTFNNKGQ